MAHIEKRIISNGKIRFRAKIRITGFPMRSATFDKFMDARNWARAQENDVKTGKYSLEAVSKKYTVHQMIDRYVKEIQKLKKNKPNYLRNKLAHLHWWKSLIGNHRLNLLNHFHIADCEKQLLTGGKHKKRGPATANRYMASLSDCFNCAKKKWGWIKDNPIEKLTKYKEPRGRLRYLAESEIKDLLTACELEKRKPLKMIVVLALCTGARKMELLSLQWKDIYFERGQAVVNETKNNERRILFLGHFAVSQLQEYYPYRHYRSRFVFPARHGKTPVNIEREFRRALNRARITDFHFHDLRHTAASYLAMNGATHSEIAEVLGHKALTMVKRYAHLCHSHTASVVERMNSKMFLPEGKEFP